MGAWGTGSFENDAALDWVYAFRDSSGTAQLTQTLQTALDDTDYLDLDDASAAVATAEVVAALKGVPAPDLPDEVQAWVANEPTTPDPALIDLALRAIDRVLGPDSELKEIWEESDLANRWQGGINNLKRRLRA